MKYKILKKISVSIAILQYVFFGISSNVFALETNSLIFEGIPATVAQQQQFYIDVKIDTHGTSINGIEGRVSFPENILSFVRAETGNSNVTLWVTSPTLSGNSIDFSGVIPGGFDGLIDPFNPETKHPGEIMRLVFVGKISGNALIKTEDVHVTANDGRGTLETISNIEKSVAVSDVVAPSVYTITDTISPTLSAQVITDPNLFDGKFTLVFQSSDKQSGVGYVQVKESDDGEWTTVESPYMLHNQSKRGILSVRAYDVAGNVTTLTVALPFKNTFVIILLVGILVLGASIIVYVTYKKKIRSRKK
jgi:hypothetical protein